MNNKMKMTTVQIEDYYGIGPAASIRVTPTQLGYQDQRPQGFTHCAHLTEGQIAKLQRLPNGPRSLNVTRQDRITGKAIEGEVYFNL
jgi:hypothetical protein